MIDGKVCHFLTDTSSNQVCNVCGIKPSKMNKWAEVQSKVPNEEVYKLGIPVLHAKIRAFENIKNIGLRADMKTYYVSSPEQKATFAENKKKMQL